MNIYMTNANGVYGTPVMTLGAEQTDFSPAQHRMLTQLLKKRLQPRTLGVFQQRPPVFHMQPR